MKGSGIWIDRKKAWIMRLDGDHEKFEEVVAELKEKHSSGSRRGATGMKPQVADDRDRSQDRKDEQFRKFYDMVIEKVRHSDQIMIEGPAKAKLGLCKRIEELAEMNMASVEVRAADKKTENQFKAGVRDFFADPA